MVDRLNAYRFDLLTLAVFCAIAPHLVRLPIWLSGGMIALLALRWTSRRHSPHQDRFPWWLRLPLTMLLPLALVAQYGTLFGREPGSALAAGMLVLKLCESEQPRDVRSAVTFGSFLLVAALLFEQALTATTIVAAGLVPQLMALRALQPDAVVASRKRLQRDAGLVLRMLMAAVPLASTTFLFLPRLGTPLWGAPELEQGKTGIGDDMHPGRLTELLVDDSPAFRVEFDAVAPPPEHRYWRAGVLWRYDGTRWYSAPGDANGVSTFLALSSPIGYEVSLEPTHQRKLPVLDLPFALPEDTLHNGDFVVLSRSDVTTLRRYHVSSVLDYRIEDLEPTQRSRALTLPTGFNPRAIQLAQQWRAIAQHDDDVIQSALALFNKHFSYTLNAPPIGRNAMDDFLFETRAGYCEHFSSAFTVLMRAAGIPARVVIGYQGGFWNPLGNYLVVRQSDAHAWSEVWLDAHGWVRIDPTGAVSPERVQHGAQAANAGDKPWYGAGWLVSLRNRWDIVNRFWNEAVVRFDTLRQAGLLTPFGVSRVEPRELAIALGLSTGGIAIAALLWALRRGRRHHDALDQGYALLCDMLAARGLLHPANEGPRAFGERAMHAFPAAERELKALFSRYVSLRYASTSPTPEAVSTFNQAVHALRRQQRMLGSGTVKPHHAS